MAYVTALPYENPTKLSAWEVPFAVAGALVDCLTCGVRCREEPPAQPDVYWQPAVSPPPPPRYRPYISGENVETKAVFTTIPLREEAIRQGFIPPAEGESPYTTLYTPPLGSPLRLVPLEAAAANAASAANAAGDARLPPERCWPPPYAYWGSPVTSVSDVGVQAGAGVTRTTEVAQPTFVAAAGNGRGPGVAVAPACFEDVVVPPAAAAMKSPHEEATRVFTTVKQQEGRKLQRGGEEEGVAAYQTSYLRPVVPSTFEVYVPRGDGSWALAAGEQQPRQYAFAGPRVMQVSQAVQTVFEGEEEDEEEEGEPDANEENKIAAAAGAGAGGSSEKDSSQTTEQTERTEASPFAARPSSPGKRRKRKVKGSRKEKEGLNGGKEEEVGWRGDNAERAAAGGGRGEGGELSSNPQTHFRAFGEAPEKSPVVAPYNVRTETKITDEVILHHKQPEYATAGNRYPVGFVPPVPPQQYKEIYVGGRPYLQGGVFYLSDTGAYLLGL